MAFVRIAQVAPLYESVPPSKYGGTERVVSYLTEDLVRKGHEVTLFASGDSKTNARLIAPCPTALKEDATINDPLVRHMIMLDQVGEHLGEFDVIHFHTDYLHFPCSRFFHMPRMTTLHGRLDLPDLKPLYRRFVHEPVISISNSQRTPLQFANWLGTVYHGLPAELCTFHDRPLKNDPYLAFVGRISPEKRPDRAIEIAQRCGIKLKIAAKVDDADRDYYEREIRPLLSTPGVEFVNEVDDRERDDFVGNAIALLFPIDWPEPFGLVMIESLGCGTPVVAWRCGSVPEIITDGTTGFICESIDEAVGAVGRISELSRAECRREFESRFRDDRMTREYVQHYEFLVASQSRATGTVR